MACAPKTGNLKNSSRCRYHVRLTAKDSNLKIGGELISTDVAELRIPYSLGCVGDSKEGIA
jgi:hypothetical protein